MARKENYPEKPRAYSYNDHHDFGWMMYNFINLEFEEDKIIIKYYEGGRCGDSDECIHTIEVTEDLLTEEGQDSYVAQWVKDMKLKLSKQERQEIEERNKKIQRLESEIKQLQSN